jgi:hypothetical protein
MSHVISCKTSPTNAPLGSLRILIASTLFTLQAQKEKEALVPLLIQSSRSINIAMVALVRLACSHHLISGPSASASA